MRNVVIFMNCWSVAAGDLLRVAFVRDSGLNTVTDGLRHE
jgi:hypothetical protein